MSHLVSWRELRSIAATASELLCDGLLFLKTIAYPRASLAAEILFLRKQLAYYQEHQIKARRLTDGSRLSLLLWSRFFDWKSALLVVKPDRFIRWHRRAFR